MEPTHLYVYQCSLCRTVATTPARILDPLRCNFCYRFMGFKWAQPIETQAHRDIAANGLMFNSFREQPPKRCRECKQPIETGQIVSVPGVGVFCGEDCAQIMIVKHRAYQQRLADEAAAQDRKERPWLK